MSHKITKTFDFSYGHRLLDYDGKCRYLHGHNGLLEVDMVAETLDERGMLLDFGELKSITKGWIDQYIDHKMVLAKRDPIVPVLMDAGEPLYLIDENPTAENLAKHIYKEFEKMGIDIAEVRLWETTSSYATYREL